jgi:uncharacterized membrane protein
VFGWLLPMNTNLVVILTVVAAIASAAVGGLFSAWSTFAMRGLNCTDPVDAITTMKAINAEALRDPPFLLLWFGSALASLVVGVIAVVQIREPGSGYLVAGAVFTVIGAITTVLFHVPLNIHLARVDPAVLSDAAREWQTSLCRGRGGTTFAPLPR